ncbi:hypothetical protein AMELA_G00027400 [Ameiurus melas]|uniref:Uncharacterized protein n=1 Tax=Ameiurus melas TaxID=219545 RepID=A0A7J6BCR8_AMEME|nr:hypothetical protein AMELA_G00027400 [Ameiurus melas]
MIMAAVPPSTRKEIPLHHHFAKRFLRFSPPATAPSVTPSIRRFGLVSILVSSAPPLVLRVLAELQSRR